MNPYETTLADTFFRDGILNRFIRYVKIETTSDTHSVKTPSTDCQWDLAHLLVKELKELGIQDVYLDDHMYIIARLPATPGYEKKPVIGYMAHMDTSHDVTGKNVKPRILENYDGKPIKLSESLTLDPREYPILAEKTGDTVITTDGTTLLGADDKAGIAEILTAVDYLIRHPDIAHGPMEIIFTPDEETGKGMDLFPMDRMKATACYTMDGGKEGEIEAECFNAYRVLLDFTGKVIHLGSARGKLTNALIMASTFISMLPRSESPESTDGWYGYWCPLEMKGGLENASLEMYIRDFKTEGMDRRIETVQKLAEAVRAIFPDGKVGVKVEKQYLNMRQKLDERPEVLELALTACRNSGVVPEVYPIRGGTDGARLTERGIPTPNVFTGGHNYHSRFEWASLSTMIKASKVIIELVKLWAR